MTPGPTRSPIISSADSVTSWSLLDPTGTTKQTRSMSLRREPRSSSVERARVGVYLEQSAFEEAKAAYLADWSNGGPSDTFAAWVAASITRHAARTPLARHRALP